MSAGAQGIDPLGSVILIVDDQPESIEVLTEMLRDEGFTRILGTTDATKAAPLFAEHHPDLVLLDLRMPHLDGFEVMDRLRGIEHEGFLPVLVLTANDSHEARLKAFASGARDYIAKPFDRAEVMARIRSLLEVRLLQRELNSQNAVLDRRVRDRTRDLVDSRLDVVCRLADAAEWRDPETGAHAARIGRYCRRLGLALSLDERTCDLLLHTAPLHDVGKIGIPDRILLKPGPLTPGEWTVMRTHAEIGGKILAGGTSELIQTAQVIALTHHERWNGSGYPGGQRAEEIPLLGRICAVADVFDATITRRCYKPAFPLEQAITELRQGSGALFDPAVVAAFDRALPDLVDIWQGVTTRPI